MDFQTAAALSASSLLLRIITICDENGAVEKPLHTINPIVNDPSPSIVVGMCGACGGTIDDYHKEFETMQAMEGGEFPNSGAKALYDELAELREKEATFDAMTLRIHELEAREAAVKRLEDSIDSGGNKSELMLKAQLKEMEEVLKQREEILSQREIQMNDERLEVHSLREELAEEKKNIREGDKTASENNELRELKLKSKMVATQLQRQQQEHQEERDELLRELDQLKKQFDQLKHTHNITNKKLSELKLTSSKKKSSGSSSSSSSSIATASSNGNSYGHATAHSLENEKMVEGANSYSNLASMTSQSTRQDTAPAASSAQTARERRAEEALKKHADRLKAVRKGTR